MAHSFSRTAISPCCTLTHSWLDVHLLVEERVYLRLQVTIIRGSQAWDWRQKPGKNVTYWFLFSAPFVQSRGPLAQDALTGEPWPRAHSRLSPPTLISNQENAPTELPRGQPAGSSSSVEIPSSCICLGLCQVDKKLPAHQTNKCHFTTLQKWPKFL